MEQMPEIQDPNVMPEGEHPPGIDPVTGDQSNYLTLIADDAKAWSAQAADIVLPRIEGDGSRNLEDSHY